MLDHIILDASTAAKKLQRMAMEIAERNFEESSLTLIGIKDNGSHIAAQIAGFLQTVFPGKIEVLSLSINKKKPAEIILNETIGLEDKTIILMDDVANSGRTMLYALRSLLFPYPKKIQTLVLVERRHKLFPIALDYVGLSVSTTADEHIVVDVAGDIITSAKILKAQS